MDQFWRELLLLRHPWWAQWQPFSITPPRQNGPSEAERKIEALTKQLEEELEKEEESEYFGKFNFPAFFSTVQIFETVSL